MTEKAQTPKLDVQTLDYIRGLLRDELERCRKYSNFAASIGDEYNADRFDAKRAEMQNFERIVNRLIKQQEVA